MLRLIGIRRTGAWLGWMVLAGSVGTAIGFAQVADHSAVIQGVDASVHSRNDNVDGYTVTEHYSVYRGKELVKPVAEMTVKTTYQKDLGKSYVVLSETGSELFRKEVLDRVLENERTLTQPANRAAAVITSSNYWMAVKGPALADGRDCVELVIVPKRSSPYLFKGEIWVDSRDYAIVKFEGVAGKSPSMLTGPAQVSRHYVEVDGYPMATHAKAVSNSWILGQTTITIDYSDYQLKLHGTQ